MDKDKIWWDYHHNQRFAEKFMENCYIGTNFPNRELLEREETS